MLLILNGGVALAPKSYMICQTDISFKTEYFVPTQLDLMEEQPVVSLRLNQGDFHLGFDQYLCTYDFVHNKSGRANGQYFSRYLEEKKFYTYYNKSHETALIQVNSEVALEFVRELNTTHEFNLNPVKIHFDKIIPLLPEVAGAWIADLNRTHLKTAGFFGPNVHKSEEYKQAAAEGNISSLQMKYISNSNSQEHTINISKKGSLTIYDRLQTVEDEISLINDIYQKLIYPHLS